MDDEEEDGEMATEDDRPWGASGEDVPSAEESGFECCWNRFLEVDIERDVNSAYVFLIVHGLVVAEAISHSLLTFHLFPVTLLFPL